MDGWVSVILQFLLALVAASSFFCRSSYVLFLLCKLFFFNRHLQKKCVNVFHCGYFFFIFYLVA